MKEFRVTGNLNNPNTKIIMANITPHTEKIVKVIYSFKSVIYRGGDEINLYSKTFITRHIYKFKGDSSVHQGMQTKKLGPR